MSRRSPVVSLILILSSLMLAMPSAARAEGGTWPPLGQLAGGTPMSVAVEGDYAYVSAGGALTVVDISDPRAPVQVGYYDAGGCGCTRGAAVAGGYAYVAAGRMGLRVVDVSNPATPTEVGHCDIACCARHVTVAGGYAYVVGLRQSYRHDLLSAVYVIDVSDPTAPTEVGAWDAPDWAQAVAVAGAWAYVAAGYGGLRIIGISDPTAPVEVGYWDTAGYAQGVVVAAGWAYVSDGDAGLRVIDVSDPTTPTEVGYLDMLGRARDVEVAGGWAYVAELVDYGDGYLRIVDVSDPTAPAEVGSWDTPGGAGGVAVAGGHAHVADGHSGLRVIDVADPAAPAEVGHLDTPDYVYDVAVASGYAYLAGASQGLWVIDVSDPAAPTEVRHDERGASDVEVAGRWAYVAASQGLRIDDISDPTTAVEVGLWDSPGHARYVEVADGWAYVTGGSGVLGGLRIIDVSDPAAPVEVGYCDVPYYAGRVAVAGGYAYVASYDEDYSLSHWPTLHVIDVSNPAAPARLGCWRSPDTGHAEDVAVAGGYAYVADSGAGPWVIDVSDPAAPTAVGHLDMPGGAYGVAVADGYAYVGGNWAGLRIVDVSEPTSPVEVAYWETPGRAHTVAVEGGCVYLADHAWGFLVFPTYGPLLSLTKAADAEAGAPGSEVGFTLVAQNTGSEAMESVTVTDPLDPAFTFVSASAGGSYDAGSHTVTWDLGDLARGASATLAMTVGIGGAVTPGAAIANQASVAGGAGDPMRSNRAEVLVHFLDVTPEHWAYEEVMACARAGIAMGYGDGTYGPAFPVTRDQMAVYISRGLVGGEEHVPTGPAEATFPDVATDFWAYDHVEHAVAQQIVAGYGDGNYHPEGIVDRGQMAVFIARAMVAPAGDAGVPIGSESPTFADVAEDNAWAWCYGHVEYIASEGVASGYEDGLYHPEYRCTRDQMAVYICRAFGLAG